MSAASDSVMSVQVALTPSLAQRMSPSTTILASCILPSGELVADSLDFNVDGAFANNVMYCCLLLLYRISVLIVNGNNN